MALQPTAERDQTRLADFLLFLGHQPVRIQGVHYWYQGMLPGSDPKKSHFHVNIRTNRWYDFNLGAGSTLADFARRYFPKMSHYEALLIRYHDQSVSHSAIVALGKDDPAIEIQRTTHLQSSALIQYLWERRIRIDVAQHYCIEVQFTRGEKAYAAIGFPAGDTGYELRTPRHRYSSESVSPTHIPGSNSAKSGSGSTGDKRSDGSKSDQAVFLDYFDLLTFCGLLPYPTWQKLDFLVLHHPECLPVALGKLDPRRPIHLFLPNTYTGSQLTRQILERYPQSTDHRALYKGYANLNDWVCGFGKGLPSLPNFTPENPL